MPYLAKWGDTWLNWASLLLGVYFYNPIGCNFQFCHQFGSARHPVWKSIHLAQSGWSRISWFSSARLAVCRAPYTMGCISTNCLDMIFTWPTEYSNFSSLFFVYCMPVSRLYTFCILRVFFTKPTMKYEMLPIHLSHFIQISCFINAVKK